MKFQEWELWLFESIHIWKVWVIFTNPYRPIHVRDKSLKKSVPFCTICLTNVAENSSEIVALWKDVYQITFDFHIRVGSSMHHSCPYEYQSQPVST